MTSHASVTLSLSEIQNQEEKNRRAHEQKMRELEARQRQLQSATTSSGWSSQKYVNMQFRDLFDYLWLYKVFHILYKGISYK